MLTPREITDRLGEVRERIAQAAKLAGRGPESVRLVLASKTQPPAAIAAAYDAGARDFGENYVQEAITKRAALSSCVIRWHLIGHLQINKARPAVGMFNLIQTLDNQRLAAALFRLHPSPPIPVLVEINLAQEGSKSGIDPLRAESLINSVRDQVDVQGLMAIPPATTTPEVARPFFRVLWTLRDKLAAATGLELPELSMGMTDDFAVAILEGATIVRVGRAIFGER
jgi:pyridoxal phosphate enzyme (YggS family)